LTKPWQNGTTGTSTLKPVDVLPGNDSYHFLVKCLERKRNCLDKTLAQCRKRDETLFI